MDSLKTYKEKLEEELREKEKLVSTLDGKRFPVVDKCLIGRQPDCDVNLLDIKVKPLGLNTSLPTLHIGRAALIFEANDLSISLKSTIGGISFVV